MLGRVRGLLMIVAAVAISACQEDGPIGSDASQSGPDLLVEERTACERSGGRWGPRAGDTLFVCYQETRDANQPCGSSDDCDGLCLARSRTCAPIKPFLGCHEVLTKAGLPATLCFN